MTALIFVTDPGDITIRDIKGEELEALVPPTADTDKKSADSKPAEKETAVICCKACQDMDRGSAVTSIQRVTIMKTNSGHCIIIGINSDRTPRQRCWSARWTEQQNAALLTPLSIHHPSEAKKVSRRGDGMSQYHLVARGQVSSRTACRMTFIEHLVKFY